MEKRKIPYKFGWVDGICQYELRESFGISESLLPNIAVFIPGKQKGARMVGTFNEDDVNSFLEDVSRGKVYTEDKSKLEFSDRNCKEFHNNLKVSSEDTTDDLIAEILREEEERKKNLGLDENDGIKKSRRRKRKGSNKADDL